MKNYFFECYIYNENKTISGWEIVELSTIAENYKEAKENLKSHPLFDCIITNNGSQDWTEGPENFKYGFVYENAVKVAEVK
jgi:hypothetical protein